MKYHPRNLLGALALVTTATVAFPAAATTFTVTSTSDNETPGSGCTLREALRASNQNTKNTDCASTAGGVSDTIKLQAGKTYKITGAPLVATDTVTIKSGTTNSLATITGAASDPALTTVAAEVTLIDLVLRHDSVNGSYVAGLEVNAGQAHLTRVVAKNNAVGVLLNDGGQLDMLSCAVHHNDNGTGEGGGITSDGSEVNMHIEKTSVYNNKAGRGAGIFSSGNLEIRDSTIALNNAVFEAGGLLTETTSINVNLQGVTITRNTAPTGSGYVRDGSGYSSFLGYSIVTANTGGPDCAGVNSAVEMQNCIRGSSCTPSGSANILSSSSGLSSSQTSKYPENIGYKPSSSTALPRNKGGHEIDQDYDQHDKLRRHVDGTSDGVDIGALEYQ